MSWLRIQALCVTKCMHVTLRDQAAKTHLWSWDKWSRKPTYCNNQHLQQKENKQTGRNIQRRTGDENQEHTGGNRTMENVWEVQQPLVCFILNSVSARTDFVYCAIITSWRCRWKVYKLSLPQLRAEIWSVSKDQMLKKVLSSFPSLLAPTYTLYSDPEHLATAFRLLPSNLLTLLFFCHLVISFSLFLS